MKTRNGLGLSPAEVDAIMADLTGTAIPGAAAAGATALITGQASTQAKGPAMQTVKTTQSLPTPAKVPLAPTKTPVTVRPVQTLADNRKVVETAPPMKPPAQAAKPASSKAPVASIATGAITGFFVGGPVGALVGAGAGLWLGRVAAAKGLPQK